MERTRTFLTLFPTTRCPGLALDYYASKYHSEEGVHLSDTHAARVCSGQSLLVGGGIPPASAL